MRRTANFRIEQGGAAGHAQAPGGERDVVALGLDWVRVLVDGARPERGNAEILQAARRAYDQAREVARARGEPAPIDRLSALFRLAPFDEDLLLLALAPQQEASLGAVYAELHDRAGATHATPYLALTLLAGAGDEGKRLAWARLAPDAPLRRWALVHIEEAPLSALSPMALDERGARFLLGDDYLDPRIRASLWPVQAGACPERHGDAVERLVGEIAAAARPAALVLGPRRSGRRAVAREVAAKLGLALVEIRPQGFPSDSDARQAQLALVAREAALAGFAVLIDATPAVRAGEEPPQALRGTIEALLLHLDALVLVIAEARPELPIEVPWVRLAPLETPDRIALWRRTLGGAAFDAQAAAEHFSLGPAEIEAVTIRAAGRGAGALWEECRALTAQELDGLAERIVPRWGWDDIVLPDAVLRDLRAIAGQVRHRAVVYDRGGFARKHVRGRGITALFAGPSGVGKTMAAEVIAHELGLDLHRIDLSSVVSKYIGETEKNLKRVFDAAEAGGVVLFFDEADALFGKRSEVKDSHDRYANVEISYLLQRMESYGGLAILATNLKNHLDSAFLRRLRYVVDIPFPDGTQRRLLWSRAFPAETATEELDLDALARLEIAGGNIAVIAVNAAFLAAAEGSPVGMRHIGQAARSEFAKLDKQFRPFWTEAR